LEQVKRPKRRDATREKILESALALVAKSGPENLQLTDVVRHSGVHRATIYQHFKTRDELLEAASSLFASRFQAEVRAALTTQEEPLGSGKTLMDLTRRFTEFVMENPELGRIWLHGVLSSPEPSRDPVWQDYVGGLRRMTETHVAKRGLDPEVLGVLFLSGTILWPLWAHAHAKSAAGRKRMARRFADNLFRIAMFGTLQNEHFPEVSKYLEELDAKVDVPDESQI
jgi:AcrR family transcriptional regulator